MAEKSETRNIYEKLSAISLEITNVAKNLSVTVGKGSYKAVGEADVLAAVRPIEAKHRVYSYPVGRRILESGVIESTKYDGTIQKQNLRIIEVTYRFVNMDNPEEYVDIISYGDGIDSGDKAPGKAMTYADKYALLKAYKIITGEDPDQEASEPLVSKTVTKGTRSASAPAPVISESTIKDLEKLGSSVDKVAAYLKKKPEDLSDADIMPVLMAMKKKVASSKSDVKIAKPSTEVQPKSDKPTE